MKLRDWINQDKICWKHLSENPNAIELLEKNKDKIEWYNFSTNPSIFTYDYKRIKEFKKDLNEEVISTMFNPIRIQKFIDDGNNFDDYLM